MEGSNDSENGKYMVCLEEDGRESDVLIGFEEDEIKSIEILKKK